MPPEFNVFNEHCYGMNKANWSVPTGDVTKYELWASQSSDFSFPWLYYNGFAASKSVNTSKTIYMKVKVCNNVGCSDFSPKSSASYYRGYL
ncbi:MAG: hypothetical protein ACJA0T_001901 [Colwellia sp.]